MNPYKVLGVAENATTEEIKKAHRRLVKDHHPDMGGDAVDFGKIQLAYEVLSNPALREFYDKTGTMPNRGSTNLDSQAYSMFFQIFMGVVNSCAQQGQNFEQMNLVEMVSNQITIMIHKDITQGITNAEASIKTFQRVIGRFKSKKEGEEPFTSPIFRQAIQTNMDHIAKLKEQRLVAERVLVLLSEVDFETAVAQTITFTIGGSSTYGSFTWG